eukprot:45399-Prorocentrum_lima.AAC.1
MEREQPPSAESVCSRELHTDCVATASRSQYGRGDLQLGQSLEFLNVFVHNKGLLADPPGNFEYTIHR